MGAWILSLAVLSLLLAAAEALLGELALARTARWVLRLILFVKLLEPVGYLIRMLGGLG